MSVKNPRDYNTDTIRQTDRQAVGNQPDDTPATGGSTVNGGGGGVSGITSLTGDVTATGPGAAAATIAASAVSTAKIANAAVTLAKMANLAADSLLGNPTGSSATPSAITLGSGLAFSGTTLTASGTTPAGPAGGDLTGTYPNPTVNLLSGVTSITEKPIGYASGGNIQVRFDLGAWDAIALTVAASFSPSGSSGLVKGAKQTLDLLNTSGAALALTWPSAWKLDNGALPTSIANNGYIRVCLRSTGTTEAAVVASYFTSGSGSAITALTGDVTATGPGSVAATLASIITAGGPIGSSTTVPVITYDAKGRLTAVTSATITGGSGFPGYIRPEDHGAVANGTTDDSVAIMAAYNACTGGQALYLTGTYGIGTGAALNFNTAGTGIVSSPTAVFQPSTASPAATGCHFGTGSTVNYQSRCSIPNLYNFSTYGVQLNGACLLKLDVGEINGCGSGICLDGTSAASLDNTIWAMNIVQCTNAILCTGVNGGQGDFVGCNFVNGCTSWVQFSSGGQNFSDNSFECDAVEIGNTTNPKIIYNNTGGQVPGNRFIVRGFFGAGVAYTGLCSPIFNAGTPSSSNNFQQSHFFFGVIEAALISYAGLINPEFANDLTNKYEINFGGTPENVDGAASPFLVLATSSGSRSSWPGTTNFPAGQPVQQNRIPVSFVLTSSLAAGASLTAYAYSPWAQGHARLSYCPYNTSGAVVTALVDNYASHPNEILITITNCSSSAIASGTHINGYLVVGL